MRRVNECRSQRAVGARRQCRARAMGPGAVTPVAATYAIKRCAPNASASAVSVNRARIVAVARAKDGAKDGEGDDDEVGGLVCWRRGRAGDVDASVFVSSVYVDERHRRRGIGRALMMEAEKFGREAFGVEALTLSVNYWNASAITMYRNLGYEIEPRGSIVDVVCDPLRLVQHRMRKTLD